VFEDDFETDKGWSSAGGMATTGQWERANPEGTSYSGVDYQLGNAASGSYDLVTEGSAGSSVGSYDIDGGDTRFRSPDIALPNQSGLTLSFQYYLAHYSNATSDDYLRVKVVGATTETVLEVLGTGSIKGGAWQTATVNLDAFAGQTVYLLVEAADGGSGSLVEAGLDDVLIE
jgi:aminopeptidase S